MRNSDRFRANEFKPLETLPHYVQANVQLSIGNLFSEIISVTNKMIPQDFTLPIAISVKKFDALSHQGGGCPEFCVNGASVN